MTMRWMRRAAAAVVLVGLAGPSAADAQPKLAWAACGDDFECARLTVPLDYAHPGRGTIDLPVTRKPATDSARRIGTLFVDFGGPGDATAETLLAGGIKNFAKVNDRYDIVGWDPRGTGGTAAIACGADLDRVGPLAQPFPRPQTLDANALVQNYNAYNTQCVQRNARILPYISTASTARDMDRLRGLLREKRANYYGYSYGTFLGATYESLFPKRVGRFVLDGAVNPDQYINDPIQSLQAQTQALEIGLGRFFEACAADQQQCLGFGGGDPWSAYDALAAKMDATPLASAGADARTADGDDLRAGSAAVLYNKRDWPVLAQALKSASTGDGTLVRILSDAFYGYQPDGTYDPLLDRFYAITSTEGRWPALSVSDYLKLGADDFDVFSHFWFNTGYADLAQELWPVRAQGAFYGPFRAPDSAPATLVVGNTYDPATPYRGAQQLVAQLGNARLLTMVGDGHTAYPRNSRCIDAAVENYLESQVLPPAGTVCQQDVGFEQETLRKRIRRASELRAHIKPPR